MYIIIWESDIFLLFLIFCWPWISIYGYVFLNIDKLDALISIISLFQASTCYEQMCSSSGGHGTATYMCDDTRCCIIQFCPPDDEHVCTKHVQAWNKLIIKFSASIIFIVSPCIIIYLLVFTNLCTFIVIIILHKQSLM